MIGYRPISSDVTKNLFQVNVANLTGDVTHSIGGQIVSESGIRDISEAEHVTVQIDWANLNAGDAVFMVKTRTDSSAAYVNENPDEATQNATQKTLTQGVGPFSKIFHFVPANYQDFELVFDKNTVSVGTFSVTSIFKFF